MPKIQVLNLGGLNQYTNPLIKGIGEVIHSVNVDSYPFGAKTKRGGYDTYLGTADGSAVNSLFHWQTNAGSTFVYRASGSALYYSIEGTGAWTLAGNGTISPGASVGYAVLNNTLIVGDGVGSTRHTTNGTAFTNTTLAPISNTFAQYQNRIYAGGTASDLFYSTTNDATNWALSGTSDSSSLVIPGEGKIQKIFTANDRLIATKTSGLMYKWDGYSLIDTTTTLGPTSSKSVSSKEGLHIWLNRNGIYGYTGVLPQLISNAIQGQIYNRAGNGITANDFSIAPSTFYKNSYYLGIGNVTNDITKYTVNNCIVNYDLQKNSFDNYSYYNKPTAMHTFNLSGVETVIFGDSSGQCYKLNGTSTSDNGQPIESIIELCTATDDVGANKEFRRIKVFFNPGSTAKVQVSIANTFTKDNKNWVDIGDAKDGLYELAFKANSRGRVLFLKVYENSIDQPFTFYGYSIEYSIVPD